MVWKTSLRLNNMHLFGRHVFLEYLFLEDVDFYKCIFLAKLFGVGSKYAKYRELWINSFRSSLSFNDLGFCGVFKEIVSTSLF